MNFITNFTFLVKYSLFAIAVQSLAFLCILEYSLDTLAYNDFPERIKSVFYSEHLFNF